MAIAIQICEKLVDGSQRISLIEDEHVSPVLVQLQATNPDDELVLRTGHILVKLLLLCIFVIDE